MSHVFVGKGAMIAPGADPSSVPFGRATITVERELSLTLVGHIGWNFRLADQPKIALQVERDRLIFSHPKFPGQLIYEEPGAHGHALYLEHFIKPLHEKDLPRPSLSEKMVGVAASMAVLVACVVVGFLLIRLVMWLFGRIF